MVTEKRSSAYKEFWDVDYDTKSNQMAVFNEKIPPVPVVQEYSSELYAVTADVFHVYHLYFTQKINSKKKLLGFCLLKPNLI